ncbi:BamA/TamA family outer membrane protein, partial [Salmonella sp. SAL04182]
WDDRDFIPNPRKGQYATLRYTHFAPDVGSDTRFDEYQLHYSRYHAVNDKDVLAWEADGAFTQGDVPWNMLPLLGSNHRMRGYYEGRYRDKNAISGQLEYRHKLSWRHGVVGWVGEGTMGSSLHHLDDGRWLPSAGVGYRFEFKPRVNVRLDYGVGKASSGFYFQVGEAF